MLATDFLWSKTSGMNYSPKSLLGGFFRLLGRKSDVIEDGDTDADLDVCKDRSLRV